MKNLKKIEREGLKKINGGEIIRPSDCMQWCDITSTSVPCDRMTIFCPQP